MPSAAPAQDSSIGPAGNANPFRENSSAATTNTPNFYSNIEGGVAAYGRLTNADGSFNTTNSVVFADANYGSVPANAKAAVTIGSAPSDYSANYNTLNFISLGNSVQSPTYKLYYNVNPHINGYIPSPSDPPEIDPMPVGAPLLSSGWQRNPAFVPGATGDQAISSLPGNQTYQTMVEKPSVSDSYNLLVAQYTPYQNVRTFTELYQVGTTPAPLYLTDTGLANYTIAFAGNGAAQSITNIDAQTLGTGSLSAFAYRAGSGPKNFTIGAYNSGHPASLMSGQLAVGSTSQSFSNLPSDNAGTTAQLTASYSSALTAGHTDTAALNLTSNAGNVSGNVNINIVGPAFSGSSSTANFPNGAEGGFFVTLANNSTYTAIPTFSDLDILGVSITNDPSGLFSVSLQDVTKTQLTAGASERIAVSFSGTTQPGNYFADLEVQTDQDADYQTAGDIFEVPLTVDVAPEPSTAGLLPAAGALFLGRRRRKVGRIKGDIAN